MAQAWVLAQNNWIEHRSVPVSEWIDDLNVLIEVGLAEKINDELIYVKGSKKAFLWLEQRVEAGRKGGLANRTMTQASNPKELLLRNKARKAIANAVQRKKIIKPIKCDACEAGGVTIEAHHSDYSKPLDVDWLCKACHYAVHLSLSKEAGAQHSLDSAKRTQAGVKPQDLVLDLDLSHTNTHTLNLDRTNTKKEDLTNSPIEEKKKIEEIKGSANAKRCGPKEKLIINSNLDLNREIWEAYKSAYEKKYRVTPVRNAKTNSVISNLGKRLGSEAVQVVEFFVRHPSSFYINKTHDIACCLHDAESLRTQMVRGQAITRSDLKRYEQAQERNSLREAIERGEI